MIDIVPDGPHFANRAKPIFGGKNNLKYNHKTTLVRLNTYNRMINIMLHFACYLLSRH